METGSFIPNYPGVEGGTPEVSEVFGRNTPDVLQMADESDAWSEEMGDDSVFYSDEEQDQKDRRAFLPSHFGVKRCRQLVNSVAEGETLHHIEEDPGDVFIHHGSLEKQAMWTKEGFHNLHMLTSLQAGKAETECTKMLLDVQTKYDTSTPEEKGKIALLSFKIIRLN